MITMIDVPGLVAKIEAAGHWVQHHTDDAGVSSWRCSDEQAVQTIIDAYTAVEAAAFVCVQIDEFVRTEFDRHTSRYSPGEMAGWALMREEALAFQANSAALVPNLQAEAGVRGCSIAVIASRVLNNATALQLLRAAIMGIAGKHKDAVRALESTAHIAAYDWRTGWP